MVAPSLMRVVDKLLESSLKSSTRDQYHCGWTHYEGFCTAYDLDPFNLSEAQLCAFLAWLYIHPSIKAYSTYNKYICGVSSTLVEAGLPNPLKDKPIFAKCKRGLKKLVGTATKARLPVTIALLRQLRRHWPTSTKKGRNAFRMATCAVNGCFRLGELASTRNNSGSVPLRSDLTTPQPNIRSVFLRRSKTDPYGSGISSHLAQNLSSTCPVRALDELEFYDCSPSAPLFQDSKGIAIKASTVIRYLKAALKSLCLPASDYSGHSFRKGGCQSLLEMGASEADIKAVGRWNSDCWKLYVTWPFSRFELLSNLLAKHK
jgi:hypothetical protein